MWEFGWFLCWNEWGVDKDEWSWLIDDDGEYLLFVGEVGEVDVVWLCYWYLVLYLLEWFWDIEKG